ncbi:metal-dependent hydrolase [Streptomyces sp. HB2AG]|uniref:metal-dependent hydrolase n=1 Tax=Streptomyces sp. HB2AG TaxID=2983400 RepID=UPI0022AAFD27|nr:metal-dependent hydrolase [Streptomyces sp. HB2AG]MCZ2523740.1 metal-dependent hydrolase [Streptomyces sp. HB2AG]
MPLSTTEVTFPSGATTGRSAVVAALPMPEDRLGVVTAATPFHPLDHTWPDQPGDTGTLSVAGEGPAAGTWRVVDCLTAAQDPQTGELRVGTDIPVRRGDETWTWQVLHVLEVPAAKAATDPSSLSDAFVGHEAELSVDAGRRAALSAAHTGCHLFALALNEALADRWRKEVRTDGLGNPDFDSLAMDTSRIGEEASTDVYRIGKSLRKKGFTSDGLADALPAITETVNARLAGWVAAGAPVRIDTPGPELTAHRRWTCALPEAGEPVSLSCGGTHPHSLGELAALRTELTLSEDGTQLTAVTRPALTAGTVPA